MRFTTKTEYGLVCLIYLAKHRRGHPVTIRDIVKGERYSRTFTEKILQKLRTARIVTSQQGNQGGYVLAKAPSQITLKQIVEALEGKTFEVFCDPRKRKEIVCTHGSLCDVSPVWYKTKELLDQFFDTVTLEMIVSGALRDRPSKLVSVKR